jgi:hypothetical protein
MQNIPVILVKRLIFKTRMVKEHKPDTLSVSWLKTPFIALKENIDFKSYQALRKACDLEVQMY